MFKKGKKLWATSYLIARIESAMEISRLAILKWRPLPQIEHISPYRQKLNNGSWIFSEKADCFLHHTEKTNQITITVFPEKNYN